MDEPNPFATKISKTAKIGLVFLVVGVVLEGFGVSLLREASHKYGQAGLGAAIVGMMADGAGFVVCAIGALVAGAGSRWRRGGERLVALACLGAMALGFAFAASF
jgi:hypothetical protein